MVLDPPVLLVVVVVVVVIAVAIATDWSTHRMQSLLAPSRCAGASNECSV
jgi:hypothetical protein